MEEKRKFNYRKGGNFTLKSLSKEKQKYGIKLYSERGKLLYILGKNESINYQDLVKKRR